MDEQRRCMGCMRPIGDGERVCPVCGWDHWQIHRKEHVLPPGTVLYGKYLVGKDLGMGGFGITYLGLDLSLDLKVAIKEYFPRDTASRERGASYVTWRLPPEAQDRGPQSFLREARKMARMDRIPGIVHVRDFFRVNNTAYIVMDFIEGETLLERLGKTGPMSAAVCYETLRPVMDALSKAHDRGLIHRDISPDNIMIDREGDVWLLDLGAAKVVDSGQTAADGHGPTSVLVVKKGFSPMEQYAETAAAGPWMDVYSLCATMYYCITGRLVPDAPGRAIDKSPLPFPPSVPADVAAVLEKGLAFLPDDRWESVPALTAALDRAIHRAPASGSAPTPIPPSAPDPVPPSAPDPIPAPIPSPIPSSAASAAAGTMGPSRDGTGTAGTGEGQRAHRPVYAAAAVLALLAAVLLIRGLSSSSGGTDPGVLPEASDGQVVDPMGMESDPVRAQGSFGDGVSWILYESGLLELSGEGMMADFDDVADSSTNAGTAWWDRMSQIRSIQIGAGIRNVGKNAFNGCTGLKSIEIPAGVDVIDDSAFRDCSGLENVTFADGLSVIGTGAFKNCTSLRSPAFPESLLRIEDSAFEGCTSLTTAMLPDSVGSLGGSVFRKCSGLTAAALPDGLESVPEKTFSGCPKLERIVLPSSAASIAYGAFFGCSSLRSIEFPDGLTSIAGSAFQECAGLSALSLPDGLTSLGEGAFYQCSALRSVTIPGGVGEIPRNAFAFCTALENVSFKDGVGPIGEAAFEGCTALRSADLISSVASVGDRAFKGCTSLSCAGLANGTERIGAGAYEGCTALVTLTRPESVPTSNGWSNVCGVMFPETVSGIGAGAFHGCTRLKGAFVPDGRGADIAADAFDAPAAGDSAETVRSKTLTVRMSVLEDEDLATFAAYCDSRRFDGEEYRWYVDEMDQDESLFARNAFYARHGMDMDSLIVRTYFGQDRFSGWPSAQSGKTSSQCEAEFSALEQANLDMVVVYDYKMGFPGRNASAISRLRYFASHCDEEDFAKDYPSGYLDGFDAQMPGTSYPFYIFALYAIDARSGQELDDPVLRDWFQQFDWYDPVPSPAPYNAYQTANLAFLRERADTMTLPAG